MYQLIQAILEDPQRFERADLPCVLRGLWDAVLESHQRTHFEPLLMCRTHRCDAPVISKLRIGIR